VSKEIWSELQSAQSDASADAPSAREPRRPHLTARTLVRGDTEPATAATYPRRQPPHLIDGECRRYRAADRRAHGECARATTGHAHLSARDASPIGCVRCSCTTRKPITPPQPSRFYGGSSSARGPRGPTSVAVPCCRPSAPRLAAARCQQAGAAHARDAHGTHTTDSERLTHCVTLARVSLHCLHRPEKGNPRSGHRAATRDHPRARGRASRDRGRSREIEGERAVIRQVDTAPGVNSILSRSSLARPARLSRARPRHAAHRRARRQRCSRSSAPSAGCCRA
jgi:hypothetical protein